MINTIKRLGILNFFCFGLIIFTIMFIGAGCASQSTFANLSGSDSQAAVGKAPKVAVEGVLKVHFIDVGQGDSILLQQGNQNMLIDTGTNESKNSLLAYLKTQNIKEINYLVLTHPHEDHIGGAATVIKNINIGTLYMTKYTTTTKTYSNLVSEVKAKGIKATVPVIGTSFMFGTASCIFYGPVDAKSGDLNTGSIVMKITFGKNSFLFTGDAQGSNESAMIKKGFDLSADVLKVGHHGSVTSTIDAFLKAVSPKYAVISAGMGNDYGHPHKETMEKLQEENIPVYRTDENGTIIATSDGKTISFNRKPGDYTFGSSRKK